MNGMSKGICIGAILMILVLAITFSLPYNETRLLIENGYNPFWVLFIAVLGIFGGIYLIIIYLERKKEEKTK